MRKERKSQQTLIGPDGELLVPLPASDLEEIAEVSQEFQTSESDRRKIMSRFIDTHLLAARSLENYCIPLGEGENRTLVFRNPVISYANTGDNKNIVTLKYLVANSDGFYIVTNSTSYIPKGSLMNKSLEGDLEYSRHEGIQIMPLINEEHSLVDFHNNLREIARNINATQSIKVTYENSLPVFSFSNSFHVRCKLPSSLDEVAEILSENEKYYKKLIEKRIEETRNIEDLVNSDTFYSEIAHKESELEEKPKIKSGLSTRVKSWKEKIKTLANLWYDK